MKFLIVKTWNGEGYSDQENNNAYIVDLPSIVDAEQHLLSLAIADSFDCDVTSVKELSSKHVFLQYTTANDDAATYFAELLMAEQFVYGVEILCNINELNVHYTRESFTKNLIKAKKIGSTDGLEVLSVEVDFMFLGAFEGDIDYAFIKLAEESPLQKASDNELEELCDLLGEVVSKFESYSHVQHLAKEVLEAVLQCTTKLQAENNRRESLNQ